MQLCFFEGKICKSDPELKMTQSGKQLCTFAVQVQSGYGKFMKYVYINCIAWGKQAEVVSKYFKKKSLIQVRGEFENNNYQRKDGTSVNSLQFNVLEVKFPPKNNGTVDDEESNYAPDETYDTAYGNSAQQTYDGFAPIVDDNSDLPF